ncbi:HlyD family secretion protein [Ochrobactrum cytisi]|nr:HlyD family secretion protein [Brucella cytisi]
MIVAGIGLAIVIPLGWGSWVAGMTNQTTDNAYLRADTTPVSAEVGGRIVRLLVEDYQHVKIGQLLMQIDPTQYQAQVDQAKASVAAARATIRNAQSNITLQQRLIEQAEAGLAALNADRERVVSEGRRQTSLTKDGWSTAQKLEAAIADVKRIEAQIAEKQAEIAAERQKLDVLASQSDRAQAELSNQQAALRLAQIDRIAPVSQHRWMALWVSAARAKDNMCGPGRNSFPSFLSRSFMSSLISRKRSWLSSGRDSLSA